MKVKELIAMDTHQSIETTDSRGDFLNVIRVPNGWIYTRVFAGQVSSVFVPIFKRPEL